MSKLKLEDLSKDQTKLFKLINKRAAQGGRIRIEELPMNVCEFILANKHLIAAAEALYSHGDTTPYEVCILDKGENSGLLGMSYAAHVRNTKPNALFLFTDLVMTVPSYFSSTSNVINLPEALVNRVSNVLPTSCVRKVERFFIDNNPANKGQHYAETVNLEEVPTIHVILALALLDGHTVEVTCEGEVDCERTDNFSEIVAAIEATDSPVSLHIFNSEGLCLGTYATCSDLGPDESVIDNTITDYTTKLDEQYSLFFYNYY